MRKLALAIAAVAALSVLPSSAFSQPYRGGGQCEELRLACENKRRLGEQGEGNCRLYRETCQQRVRRDVCGELRAACLNKDKLGEQGEGNCRRYRQECRGRN
jgi:hypothetical protein